MNVLSQMYDQWLNAGSPRDFDWQPVNACPITKDFKVEDYNFGQLIWSTFTLEIKKTVTEPFGCLVKSKIDGSLFLVFRGSKSLDDFLVDAEFKPVPYSAPTPNPQGCSVLCVSGDFEEDVDVDGGAPSGIFDVVAAIGA